MKLFKTIAFTVAILSLSLPSSGRSHPFSPTRNSYYKTLQEGLPFPMGKVCEPQIPSKTVSINDFGGVGDGVTLNTDAFAKAIGTLSSMGGGHLIIPAGIWLTGPIELKSNIDLHISHDAIIIFSSDRNLYPLIETSFEGLDTWRCESPIHAKGAHDISITGGGVIDGNGHNWRPVKKSKLTSSQWKELKGGWIDTKKNVWYPSEAYYRAEKLSDMNVPPKDLTKEQLEEMKDFLRPVMVSLRNCTNVLLEDCTFQNSPAWNIHPLLCKSVIIDRITVRNPSYAQNGDGIDIESCTDVFLTRSTFDVGDDGICVKSGKDADGRRRGVPTKGLVVDGCTVYRGHGGFVVGSEMSGGVENVKVSGCRFLGTDVGLRFKSKRGRGGVVRNIWIENMHMTDIVTETVLFDLFYEGKSAVEVQEAGGTARPVEIFPVDETTPEFRDIHISDVVCNGAGRAMYFNGLQEMPVSNIEVSNCTITSKKGIEMNWVKNVTLDNVTVKSEDGESIKGNSIQEIKLK